MRPCHTLVAILALFVIFGLPEAVRGTGNNDPAISQNPEGTNATKINLKDNGGAKEVLPLPKTESATTPKTPETAPTSTTPPTTTPTSTTPPTTTTTTPTAPETFIIYKFQGNFDIHKLFELLNTTTGTVTVNSGGDGVFKMNQNFPTLTITGDGTELSTSATENKNNTGCTAVLQFLSTASPTTTTTTLVPEIVTTKIKGTTRTRRTTGKPIPTPSPVGKMSMKYKVLLFLCLSTIVIMILVVAYKCFTVDSCWEQFKTYCFPRGNGGRERRGMGLNVMDPIRNRLINGRDGPAAHPDYPDPELYDRL